MHQGDANATPDDHLQQEWLLFQQLDAGDRDSFFRVWEARRPVVVVGRSTTMDEHVILDACHADGVRVIRRVSGGGTVVLGPGCLNYAIGLAVVSRPDLASVQGSFTIILGAIVSALGIAGLSIEGTTDLAIDGRKVSGNAQRRGRRALIQHGTLLYDFDPALATRYLREPCRRPAYRAGRPHAGFLGNLPLPKHVLEARVLEMGSGVI
jgi:lipoate-protein ligase A